MTAPADFLSRARRAIAEATPGPLVVERGYDGARTVAMMRSVEETISINTVEVVSPRPYDRTAQNAALHVLAVNAMPALLEVAEAAVVLRSMVGYDTFGGGAWDTAITALHAALARLAEVPGE